MFGIKKDSEGIPWDERIHVLSKTKATDGKWKVKRNVNPEYLDAVKKELLKYWGTE